MSVTPQKPSPKGDPLKRLTPEEEAFMAGIRQRQQRSLFGAEIKAFLLILSVIFFVLTLYVITQPSDRHPSIPTYADCQILLAPNVNNVAKLKVATKYFPYRPLCRMKSGYFTVTNVFQTGTSQARLTLTMNRFNTYEMDAYELLDALLPDREKVPAAEAGMALVHAARTLDTMSSGNIDVGNLMMLLSKSGALSSYAGENAAIIKAQLARMQQDYVVPDGMIVFPVFIDALIPMQKLRPKNETRIVVKPSGGGLNLQPRAILDFLKQLGSHQE
jgi:hypothetical protein